MRVVHARKRIGEVDSALTDKFNILVWALSVLRWKQFNNEIVLYTDTATLNDLKIYGIDKLYDEVDTGLFEESSICNGIDMYLFWAMPKILSLHYETKCLGNNVLVADQDVVPERNLSDLYDAANVLVWSDREFVEDRRVYPEIFKLSLPSGYELPNWFSGNEKPLNTGIIHFRKNKDAIEYCDEVIKYVRYNRNPKNNNRVVTMCNAEQRMMGEWLHHKRYSYMTVQPKNEGLFNSNAFHTHGYKTIISNRNSLDWNLKMLEKIKECNEEYYNTLLELDLFKEEKSYINGEQPTIAYRRR